MNRVSRRLTASAGRPSTHPWPFLTAAFLALMTLGAAARGGTAAPRKQATAVKLTGALSIDGRLDEAQWQQAPVHTGFEMPLGQANRQPIPEDRQTFFRVMHDTDNLYFGIRCAEPHMDQIVSLAGRTHDAAMWSDDDIEIFLDPTGDRTEYYQLAVNTDGTQVDLYLIEGGNTGKAGWSSEWQAAVHKDTDSWSVEICLPFGLFHNRPSKAWADTWAFSVARTRKPKPSFFSQYSPATKYHDVSNFGTLGPIQVDRRRFNLYADSPRFRLERAADGYNVTASLQVENRGDTAFVGVLEMDLSGEGATGAETRLSLGPNSGARVEVKGARLPQQGKWPVVFRCTGDDAYTALVIRFDEWLTYTPLTIELSEPNYRNAIFATQTIDAVRGNVRIDLSQANDARLRLRVSLLSSAAAPATVEADVSGNNMPFELPADALPEGEHTIRAELLRPKAEGGAAETQGEVLLEETEVRLRKLPPAPAVEARIDDQGNLLVDGTPVFIRGWYGSMGYVVSKASFPRAQLPHSTNFLMGASQFERTDMGVYTLTAVTRLIDETKAKTDQPIDGQLKAKLFEAIATTRMQRNVIGYYISDEPECRGLSPTFLKSLFEFMAEHDPYRFCKIVSRDPVRYMDACDVICPHPYMNPQQDEDGNRAFGSYLRNIHAVMTAAVGAKDCGKAVWCMPQTFSYGGLQGRHPTFRESRWFTHTAIACGAKGIVPFIFNGFWNHVESRIGMGYVFEELAFLAPAWIARDSAVEALSDNPDVDVIAKSHKPERAARGHLYIVAANQSYSTSRAIVHLPMLENAAKTELIVLRENRVVTAANGTFTDEFPGLGVHVYTTNQVLPYFETLSAIEREIAQTLRKPFDAGNLLASGKVKWSIGQAHRAFSSDRDLADGAVDAAGWLPVYGDRSQCEIVFARPVTFSGVVAYSPTIKAADLDVWVNDAWKTVHQWKDQLLPKLEYRGQPMTATRIRIRPTASRQGYGTWEVNEITELAVFE